LTILNKNLFVKRVLYLGIYAILKILWFHTVVQRHLYGMVGYTMLNFVRSLAVKEFRKSINISRSYRQEYSV